MYPWWFYDDWTDWRFSKRKIPALRRLIEANPTSIAGKLLLADAETAGVITAARGDYLLVVKGNQKDFFADMLFALTPQPDLPGTNYQATAITKDIYRPTHTQARYHR